ncbi:MAG: 16S rRNA (cytosine(967)-C(5))-methyltransferase RsmB [Clostridia bacterium]|nr:16S rRNA (cytosine(967)-C(5))-methyltransferase RsmB [Clostridia bacterium]
MIDKAREIALKALYKIDKENAFSNIALDEELNKNYKLLNEKDVGLISQIVYGVTTWRLTLDCIIEKYSKIKLKKISPWIINILRMGIYQIIFLDKIPKSAAVDESVNLAKRYGHKTSSGFVNAILRKVETKDYEELCDIEQFEEKISKSQSMPKWLIQKLLENNNIEKVEEICKNLNLKPQISIRINKLKTNNIELAKELENKGIETKQGELEDFLIIKNAKNIEKIKEFKEGDFTVQDESAGLAALFLNPKKGENVLDACSAPGGKTTHLAEIMGNEGRIEAWDIYEHRLKLIEENCKRLDIKIVNTKIQNAENQLSSTSIQKNQNSNETIQELPQYDKILLDVPCMGTGVIKRKPDIKWQRKPEDVEEITKIQFNILQNCSKLLKQSGEVVYSTCSILKDENEEIIEKFLQKNPDFEIITEQEIKRFPQFEKYLKDKKYLNILPNEEHDGFFICKLKYKGE